jgi:hypothetical protein
METIGGISSPRVHFNINLQKENIDTLGKNVKPRSSWQSPIITEEISSSRLLK